MAKTNYKTIDEYISDLSDEDKIGVRAICDAVVEAVPYAEGTISYQLPAFRHNGWILYVSAHRDHYTISCPPPSAVFEAFKEELAPYSRTKTSTAVKLPKKKPLPLALIGKMAAWQARNNAG
jgi:uncharacterized protein YdhG (YjbR/CyaY superfamily)